MAPPAGLLCKDSKTSEGACREGPRSHPLVITTYCTPNYIALVHNISTFHTHKLHSGTPKIEVWGTNIGGIPHVTCYVFSPCYFITCIGRPFVTNQNSCHTLSFHGRLWYEGAEFDLFPHGLGYITKLVLFVPLAFVEMNAITCHMLWFLVVAAVAIRGLPAVRAVLVARTAAIPLTLHNNNDNR